MARRVAVTCVAVVLALPATAASQTPPDERAAAQAFADAALRFRAALGTIEPRYEEMSRAGLPRCVRRPLRRVPEHRMDEVIVLQFANVYGELGRLFEPALTQFSTELHGVSTADPALQAGRTAWRRTRRVFAALAAIPPVDVCAETRRFVAGGFEPTPATRRARPVAALLERDPLDDFNPRVERAQRRLRELGIPREHAEAFEGDIDDQFEDDRRR